tara:strand:- start:11868 stop:12182 length:315 start_codon:yes stop_codon:yes gene_type:complete
MKPDIIKQAKIIFNSKLEFETIQKIAFDRGFHWINQSPSKPPILVPFEDSECDSIILQNNQIYAGYGFSKYSSYTQSNCPELSPNDYIKSKGFSSHLSFKILNL